MTCPHGTACDSGDCLACEYDRSERGLFHNHFAWAEGASDDELTELEMAKASAIMDQQGG